MSFPSILSFNDKLKTDLEARRFLKLASSL